MAASSFTFFASYFDAIEFLPDEQFGQMLKAICVYALRGEEPNFDNPTLKGFWTLIRPTLDRSVRRSEAGRIGGLNGAGVSRNQGNGNASKSIANSEQDESKTIQESIELGEGEGIGEGVEKESKGKKRKAIAYPYDEVVSLWNEICSPLPQVKRLNDSRRNKIKCRLVEFSKNSEEWLPKTRELFERVVASDFLRGEKADWQATFDWLFDNSKNWVKVVEGNYDNERKRTTQQPEVRLGVGEFLDEKGERRYGSGNLPPVPMDAPPRPDNDSIWSRESNSWIPTGV